MFNWFKSKNQQHVDPNTDFALADIAHFLIDDKESGFPLPMRDYLDAVKLDYSLESIKEVDSYLEHVYKDKDKLTDEQLLKIVLRCGGYVGEVIKRQSAKKFRWIKYDEAVDIDQTVKNIERSSLTLFILYSEPRNFSFPIAKAAKYIQNDSEDSLYYFAVMVGEFKNK